MGATFEALAPTVAGEYHIFITAHAAGYRDVTKNYPITVLECVPMQGRLDINIPEIIKEEPIRFTARGITLPTEENITYEWNIFDNSSPASFTGGAVWELEKAPSIPGSYTVSVKAEAKNYCTISLDTTILVKPWRKMQGMLDFTPSEPIIKGQKVTFTAHGITTPSAERITYEWFAPAFTAGTISGNSYTAVCPDEAKTYAVSVTATATGYTDSTVRRVIVVGDELAMQGNVSISVPPEVIVSQPVTFHVTNNITVPSNGISFVWDTPFFNPNTHQSQSADDNTFTTVAPAAEGDYIIRVTARAAKYSGMTASRTVTVKGGKDMTGTLDFDEPPQIVKDLEATFTVKSTLSTSDGSPITYEWYAPGFTPATFTGSSFTGIPTIAGTRTITLRAKANGYTTIDKAKSINVMDGLDMGELKIIASGGGTSSSFTAGINTVAFIPGLTPPIPSVTYTWNAPQCTPKSFTGNEFNPTLPSNAGDYSITLEAKATGYHTKTTTFDYIITCTTLPVDFKLSRTELLTNEETILTVTPSVSTASYTWAIPNDFTITAGSSITPSVTIKAPGSEKASPVPLTLNAEAVNFCPNSHSETVTVKACYPLPPSLTPTITSNATDGNDGRVHATNLQTVRFETFPIAPRRSGGTTTYSWDFGAPLNGGYSFTPSSSPAAINNTVFETKAPLQDADRIYTLKLQIAADGYCPFNPVVKNVIVDKSNGKLTGTVKIVEAVAPTSDPNNPVVWLANGRPVTLRAQYLTGIPEELDNLEYDWFWVDENNDRWTLSSPLSNKGRLTFIPAKAGDFQIGVRVNDLNGKEGVGKSYSYTVQNCGKSDLPSLRIDVNYPCGFINNTYATAYVIDSVGGNYTYKAVSIGGKWWLTENLRKGTTDAKTSYIDDYGAYYPTSAVTEMVKTDGVYCPKGWRIPNETEWESLNKTASPTNNNEEVFQKLAIIETESNPDEGSKAWNSAMVTNAGLLSNTYGFSLIPAGFYLNNILYNHGKNAEFFISSGGIQGYGLSSGGPANGTAYPSTLMSGRYYTARCVND
jgi:uncharacterized protein (TIGR02145 family)